MFAQKLIGYQTDNCAIVALSRGSVLVGAQIAVKLHCNIMMLMTENIDIPGEPTPLAAMSDANILTYNKAYSGGEIEEFTMEYFNLIEQQRIEKVHQLHLLMDDSGQVDRNLLRHHTVIVVSDGLSTGLSLDVAADYLKPIKMARLIAVCPVVSPQALDRMRLFADEIHCLNIADNYITTDHYYEDNTIPSKDGIYKIIRDISLNWDRPAPPRAKPAGKAPPKSEGKPVVPKPASRPEPKPDAVLESKPDGVLSIKH